MAIDNIAEGRRREIAEEFDDLLSEGKDTEEAGRLLALKYNITKQDVEAIVRGERIPDDDDPDTGRAA